MLLLLTLLLLLLLLAPLSNWFNKSALLLLLLFCLLNDIVGELLFKLGEGIIFGELRWGASMFLFTMGDGTEVEGEGEDTGPLMRL